MGTVTCPGCRGRDPRIQELESRVAELDARNRDLQARVGTNATNSSMPPSANPPGAATTPPGSSSGPPGMPPHQYVIARRIERAQEPLREGDLSLAEVAACAGFWDQSQFSRHFKRVVGVTPGRFRRSARIAENAASPAKNPGGEPFRIPP
jgi:hypothetical protein